MVDGTLHCTRRTFLVLQGASKKLRVTPMQGNHRVIGYAIFVKNDSDSFK